MESTLKKYFGHPAFRPYQREIIEKILEGRDSLVVMATGSGKSLCYQVPPLVTNKTAIVISPLLSLMQDQVMALRQRDIRVEHLSSAQIDASVQSRAADGQFDILYMTPEKACSISTGFWSSLLNKGICLVAVDEAHCISEWGHDFRTEYKQLDKLRNVLLSVPFVALTATATEKVKGDVINSLKMRNPYISIGSFDRKNLFYSVKPLNHTSTAIHELVEEISKRVANAGSTIVYCTTIKDAEQIFSSLLNAGLKAGMYHGRMSNKTKEESHRLFIRDELNVMVATIAFGMGIDKPDIRLVIHYGCPKSLESYYQESGRCGRDGVPSHCWLYYSRSDFSKTDFYCKEASSEKQRKAIAESLIAAQRYCMLTTCRRKSLLNYFGEDYTSEKCGNCDNCIVSKKERDMSKEAFLLMVCVRSCGGNWGLNMPIDVLRGSRSKKIVDAQFDKLPYHGHGKDLSADWWKELGHLLIVHGYLKETVKDIYRMVSVSPKGSQFLNSSKPDHQPSLVLPLMGEMLDDEDHKEKLGETSPLQHDSLSQVEAQIYKMLYDRRVELARDVGTAPYAICSDETLKRLALTRPSTKARLANIDGVNQHFVKTYGDHILQSIEHMSQELNLSLDGKVCAPPPITTRRPAVTIPNGDKKLAPAKTEAWKMWYEDGLSAQQIANFPGRSAPIKEETVLSYLLEAATQGYEFDWNRFCQEIELSPQIYEAVHEAIMKVGARDKLKPIKTELPEEISYFHIKSCLTIQDLGISAEIFPSSLDPNHQCKLEEESIGGENTENCDATDTDQMSPNKRRKIGHEEDNALPLLLATESSILSWLGNHVNGVSLSEILVHFKGTEEQSIVEMLSCLESEFSIFKKGDLYRLM
ncbi:ATP-dependent DNA helicase RecQ-like [Impatiens glandulifera]|uniref:ATP-dependent DNA helicase RecQ-like n=1 Tax=Impatiens glandulifera TaxID=253017 RepID=UPI001FB12EA1|nr:ATP-dependent DNA helicase RecQ-like [Impatiens glandulifera]